MEELFCQASANHKRLSSSKQKMLEKEDLHEYNLEKLILKKSQLKELVAGKLGAPEEADLFIA